MLTEATIPSTNHPSKTAARLAHNAVQRSRRALLGGMIIIALVGMGAAVIMAHYTDSRPNSTGTIGGPFSLTQADGHPVTDRDFRGKYLLIYFGYTACPDVCPTTLNDVATALSKLGEKASRLQPLFITVDPQRDTPEVVGKYTASFPGVIGLSGTAQQIDDVARAYRIVHAHRTTGPGPQDYSVDHSSVLYLMGPDGSFIAPIPADTSADVIASDLSRRVS